MSDRRVVTPHRRDPSIRLIQFRRSAIDQTIEAEILLPTGKKVVSTKCSDMIDAMFIATDLKADLVARIAETGNATLRRGRKPKLGSENAAVIERKAKGPTFKDAARLFREEVLQKQQTELAKLAGQPSRIVRAKGTKYRSQISIVDNRLTRALGDLTYSEITISVVRQMMHALGIEAQNTIGNYAAAYQKVMCILADLSNATEEWPTISKKGRAAPEPRGTFSAAEVHSILSLITEDWIESSKKLRDRQARRLLRAYLHLAAITGIRPGNELTRIAYGDIVKVVGERGRKHWVISVYKNQGKTKKDREAVVNDRDGVCSLDAALTEIDRVHGDLHPNTMLFRLPCDGTSPDFGMMFSRLIKIRHLTVEPRTNDRRSCYSLRHYYANTMISLGADAYRLSKVMGTSVTIIETYYGKALDRRTQAGLAGVDDPQGRLRAALERRPASEQPTSLDIEGEEQPEESAEYWLPRN